MADRDDVDSDVLLARAAEVLKLLADATRLAVLDILTRHDERSVNAIAEDLRRPSSGVSQHLAKLRAAGLVLTRREGTTVHYRLAGPHVSDLVRSVTRHTEHLLYDVPPHHRG